ncbi:hypothetical protein [Methylovirgula sp. 4M-Z18]|uniref:hypothetical protein n=1 Tax=Methylovirgula sp. 4M-Z18 TaxID=2293567 RepID=UPI001AECEFB5|nr:hypothetical protein [Methylovirgula sp. 4M-Z18]
MIQQDIQTLIKTEKIILAAELQAAVLEAVALPSPDSWPLSVSSWPTAPHSMVSM